MPAADRVRHHRQAPHLLVLLLGLTAGDLALADAVELTAQGMQRLALVQLPGDVAPGSLVRQVLRRIDRLSDRPVLLEHAAASAFCREEAESLPAIREAVACPYFDQSRLAFYGWP
ncbi:hypothetical protein OHA46_00100 [Streptomyces sp. NBC_00708]